MNLDDLLTNVQPHIPACRFLPWVNTLKPDDRDSVYRAFDNQEIPTRHIYNVLRSMGLPIRESALRSHRKGECQYCERTRNEQRPTR